MSKKITLRRTVRNVTVRQQHANTDDHQRLSGYNPDRVSWGDNQNTGEHALYDVGFKDGYKKGKEETAGEYQLQIEKIHEPIGTLISNINEQMETFLNKSQQFVLKFALSVAERIIKREIKEDNEMVVRHIKEAIHKIVGVNRITIHLNPEDDEIVRQKKDMLVSESDSIREIILETDTKIERGGCIIESDHGNIDARISELIKRIEASILNE